MTHEEQVPPPQQATAAAPEISRRIGAILDAVEREATRLREEARAEATAYLDDARRRADDLVAERQRRISALSDELVAKSEAVIARLDDAGPVRQGFENLVRALGDAAERLAREAGGIGLEPPPFGAQQPAAATTPAYTARRPGMAWPTAAAEPTRQAGETVAGGAQPVAAPEHHGVAPERSHPARTPAAPGWRGLGGEPATAPEPVTGFAWPERDQARMVAIQMAATGATKGGVREHLHRTLGLGDAGPVLDEVFGPGSDEGARVPWTASRR